ncbi:MAG: hypothetical protein QOD33_1817 [Pyrinomonadaceae bacterium]|jgi:hypothetical protein|nr:hypothetical protein [Pyrinomonadaceae bacterium]
MGVLQMARSGLVGSASAGYLSELRADFEKRHYLKLPRLLDTELLDSIQSQIGAADFHERVHEGIGSNKELCMSDNAALTALQFLLNDPQLFELIQRVTQCERIGCFQGRVYRVAAADHHDSWHDDLGEARLLGMSINLSTATYSGGAFQLRERDSGKILSEVANAGPGDAFIFLLSARHQHRITGVEGSLAKTAFAGWFRSQPDFVTLLKAKTRRGGEVNQTTVKTNGASVG